MTPGAHKLVREMITPEGVDLKAAACRFRRADIGLLYRHGHYPAGAGRHDVDGGTAGPGNQFSHPGIERDHLGSGILSAAKFYFTAFELTLRAATPGKRMIGLRVAMRDGSPLTANAVFARNFMRELEIFLPIAFLTSGTEGIDGWIVLFGLIWCSLFLFVPFFNRDRLRVGDLVGGTWVVMAPRRVLDADLSANSPKTSAIFSTAALDAYGIKELNIWRMSCAARIPKPWPPSRPASGKRSVSRQ